MCVPVPSGVAKERKVFMDLMRNEIDRVNTVLSQSSEEGVQAMALFHVALNPFYKAQEGVVVIGFS